MTSRKGYWKGKDYERWKTTIFRSDVALDFVLVVGGG
jgi:hypothetical protein